MSSWILRILLFVAVMPLTFRLGALEVRNFTYSHLGAAEGLDNQRVFSIKQSGSGAVWWSTMMGVGRYNGLKVKNYRLDRGTPYGHLGGRVIHLTTEEGVIYAFDNRGTIYVFNFMRNEFEQVTSISRKLGHQVGLNDLHVRGDKMYLALHDGVYVMKDTTLTQVMKGAYVNQIVTVEGRLLFCAREGVYDERGKLLLPYNTECGYYDELSSKLWLGGYENGLHVITFGQKGSVATDQFVGRASGSAQVNPIRSICPYDDDTMLIGIDGEGVWQVSRDGRGECALLFDANETEHGVLHGNGVYSIAVDTWKNIIIGTYSGGIDIARPIGSTTAIFRHMANEPQSLSNDNVNAVMSLSDDLVLMGTENGISIYNTKTGQWRHCCQGTVVLSATKMPGGSVLVSTYGKGVYEIDSQANGLPSNYVRSLLKSHDGRIWIATDQGLAFVMPNEPNKVVNVNYCYGLNREYARGAAQNLPDGDIIFGTTTGAIVIHPENVQSIDYTAQLVILGIECDVDQEKLQSEKVYSLLEKGEIHLAYNQRTFEVLFESVNMRNHFDIAYRYQVGQGDLKVIINTHHENMTYCCRFLVSETKKRGFSTFVWDNNAFGSGSEHFGIFDRNKSMKVVADWTLTGIMEGAK